MQQGCTIELDDKLIKNVDKRTKKLLQTGEYNGIFWKVKFLLANDNGKTEAAKVFFNEEVNMEEESSKKG